MTEKMQEELKDLGFKENHLSESIVISCRCPHAIYKEVVVVPHIDWSYLELVLCDNFRTANVSVTFEEAEQLGLALIKLAAIWKEKIPNTY